MGVGLFVSGLILVVVCSLLQEQQLATLPQMVTLAFTGALLGDHFGFYVGRFAGPAFHHTRLATRYAAAVARADALIRRFGWGAILIGRFVPAIRSLVPAITGVSGYPRLRYSLFDVIACSLWACGLALILAGVAQLT